MNKNYRSDGEIIDFVNEKFKDLIEPYDEMESFNNYGGGVFLYNTPENAELLNLVKDLEKKYDAKDIAILSRSNAQIDEIGKILSQDEIKFNKGDRRLDENWNLEAY